MDTAGTYGGGRPRAAPAKPSISLLQWLSSITLLPVLVGFAAGLRDGPGDLIGLALAAGGALLLAGLISSQRLTPMGAPLAALIATGSLAGAYLAQRGAVSFEVIMLTLPVAAAAAGAVAAGSGGGPVVSFLTLAPLPVTMGLIATGLLTPWALFAFLAIPDAVAAAKAALRGEPASASAARSQWRVTAYLALALLLAQPRY